MVTLSKQERSVLKMKQDISGSLNELQRAANLVLEMVYELKADTTRLYIMQNELEDEMFA